MEKDFKKLLERAKSNLPKSISKGERFEMPKVKGHIQGNKTIVTNFNQICDTLRRDPQQILKYLQRELATPAEIDGPRLILRRKINAPSINQKVEQYANDFVICKECKKPDTKLLREDRFLSLKCMACGAKHPLKTKI